jgi:O-antigen/teichoic acid export membrane protein
MSRGAVSALGGRPDRWVRLGGWAVADQVLFASSNFALWVLLARWMPPAEFGAFTVAQSAFLLFGMIHIALLAEPMLVFGTSRYADEFPSYLGQLVRGHWLITSGGAALFAVAAGAAWVLGSQSLAAALWGAAVATPAVLLVWLARRACFACLRPHLAAMAGGGYLLLMLLGIVSLYRSGLLLPLYAFLVLGGSSLVIGLALIGVLRRSAVAPRHLCTRELAREHWTYARWAMPSSVISWTAGNVYFFVLPITGGLAAAGALRALANLALPMFQLITALSMLLLPALARARGTSLFRSAFLAALLLFMGSATVYWLGVAGLAAPAMDLLYGGRYTEHAHLLWLLGALPVIAGLVAVVSNALRACERPDLVFWAYAASACVTLTVGLWAAARWGVAGAVVGQVAANSATAAVLIVLFRRSRVLASSAPAALPPRGLASVVPLLRVSRGYQA